MLGSGKYTYTPVENWGNFPDEVILGDVAGIAIDANDQVYLFNRGEHPVVVLCQNGEVLRTWGHGIFTNPHGASIGPDQCIYLTDNFDHTVRKFSLTGELLLELGTPGISSGFMSGRPFCKCTHSTISPSGDIFVSDGYNNACIHHYNPKGKHIKSWGQAGAGAGQFNLPHNICCDTDGWIYVADRENSRIQIFDTLGNFETQINNMHRPSGLAITANSSPDLIVGELADRGWGKVLFKSIFAMMLGMFIIYLFGIVQLSIIKGFEFAILKGMQPFIIGDFYKLILASILLPQIWKLTKISK